MFEDRVTLSIPMEAVDQQLTSGGFVPGGAQLQAGNEEEFKAFFERFKDEYADHSDK